MGLMPSIKPNKWGVTSLQEECPAALVSDQVGVVAIIPMA